MATLPAEWITGLIALGVIAVFGVPDEFGRAVYFVTLIFVMMFGSVILVYLFARSPRHGIKAPSAENGRVDQSGCHPQAKS